MNNFFAALFFFLVIPSFVSRIFRVKKLFPLVFLQLVFGAALNASGLLVQLQAFHIDLLHGPLTSALEGLGWLGVALLVSITGGEVQPESRMDRSTKLRIGIISVLGFVLTCLVGSVIGYGLASSRPSLVGTAGQPLMFSLGLGIALAVTALPVLVTIVRQAGLADHPIARLATHCAMLDDLWLWLGITAILAGASSSGTSFLWLAVGLASYLMFMFWVVRPALCAWYGRTGEREELDGLLVAVAVILMSTTLTGMIGLHSIFGSFVAGAILPREALARWREPIQQLVHVMMLPAFFILTGIHLQLDVRSPLFWQLTAILTMGAVFGKMLNVAVSARLTGLSWKTGLALGGLMQCKGLMELIAINILLDAGIIGKEMFSSLAMMAMISTFVTLPMARLLVPAYTADGNLKSGQRESFAAHMPQ